MKTKEKANKILRKIRRQKKYHQIFKLKIVPSTNSVFNSLAELKEFLSIIAMFCKTRQGEEDWIGGIVEVA